ncbi:lipocalin family protein [Flavobacterium sp.]|uniref:lipocalin family protein n=1 Tax=Flavobacterium sp. TaxID=239 RepID=UPI0026345ABE|nr:lipocalin family protein [Flavobacterium sp.]MDD3003865.1 lipocalin family protein [Flavobacterium sp.]
MKKIKALMVAFVMAGMTVVSCSSDDSSGPAPEITAKWNQTKTVVKIGNQSVTQKYKDNTDGCTKNYIEFAAANVFNDVVYFKQGGDCQESAAAPGTWTKSDKTLTITNGGLLSGTYEIAKLSGSALELKTQNNEGGITSTTTIYFTKAK